MGDDSGQDLWDAIEVAIDRKLVKSEFDRTRRDFLPEGELDRILQEISAGEEYGGNLHHVIAALLGMDFPEMTQEEQDLVGYILDEETLALKLLFTVLYSKHPSPYQAMALFKRERIHDVDLAIQWSVEIPAGEVEKHPLFALGGSSNRLWSRNCIKSFQREQKLFQAAILTTDPAKMPGQFDQRTLPFIQKDQKRSGGAFGIVHKYTIQRNHLDMKKKNDAGYVVAVKELRKDNDNVAGHWAKEVSALSKMNTLDKEHIVRFLTAFTRGDLNNLEYYVVFEWAEGGNLKDLWSHFPRQGRSVVFIKWIMKQLYGLSQALQAAHYLLDDDGEYRGASYRHGDLKPENILWFPWEGSDWGTLKICDWGEAKIHHELTALRYHTTTQFGTRRYEPPEAVVGESELSEAAKDARSRLYDIWSMGCVMMECTIWLVHGLDELKRFNKSNLGDHSLSEYFYELHKEGNKVRKVVHGAVNRWLRHMKNQPFCRPGETAIGDALGIISEGLLVVQLPAGDIDPHEVTGVRNARSRVVSPPFSPQPSLAVSLLDDSQLGQTSALHVPEAAFPRVQEPRAGASIPANPGINITPAEDLSTQMEIDELSSEPVRYRAIELADRLGDIVNGGRNDRYWLSPGSAAPVPRAFNGASHLSPGSIGTLNPPNGRNAVARPNDNVNYAHPELNRDRWTFEVDNDFAATVLPGRNHMQIMSGAGSSTPKLCGKCVDIQKRLWSPFFQETFTAEELRQNADNDVCHLCCLFWQSCVRNEATDWRVIVFQRIDSSLKISGTKSPAISLFRDNAFSRANTLQIGFAELPAPGSSAHYDTIRAWIVDCDETHTDPVCKPDPNPLDSTWTGGDKGTPTRLIDVGSEDGRSVKLKLTRKTECLQWIALSYRWGDRPHFSTTQANIEDHIQGMKLIDLPEVFQDAISMTRGLGLRYLWIDAVCIIQGEDGDFATESKKMEDVYSGAYCVLAASYSNSLRLFHTRKNRSYVALGSNENHTGTIYACEMIDNFKDHVLDGPLGLRGWVLQEHALARRTIFFTEHQTYWECGHGVRCETMAKMKNVSAALLGDPNFPKILRPAEHGERILRYQELYQQYSRLGLTADYDRPAAIDGLERRLLRAMNVSGGFGVLDDPKNPGLLRRSLMWHRATETLKIIDFPGDREKVPSWSWMSVSGPIDYYRLDFSGFEWKDIQSPWSKAKGSHTGKVILAEASLLDVLEQIGDPEINVKLDMPGDTSKRQLLAVTLGIEKGNRDILDKRHCVLVVEAMSQLDDTGHEVCKRVGAGVVAGKYLSEKRITCSIV